jgi:predicted kinase
MTKPLLIIIAGAPCTGKTTLGQRLAQELRLPFVHKDGPKELLFDCIGWSDRAWSRKLGRASVEILFYFAESLLRAGQCFIVESNFSPPLHAERFLKLKQQYGFEPFQIQCICDGDVLFERFKQRAEVGERHPGHIDKLNYEEFEPLLLKGRYDPLEIGGRIYEVDTTNFASIDYRKIIEAIRAFHVVQQQPFSLQYSLDDHHGK